MRFQLVRWGVWFIEVYYHLGMSEIPTVRRGVWRIEVYYHLGMSEIPTG